MRKEVFIFIFVNHTNHPSSGWTDAQRQAASAWGEIMDLPFPNVPAEAKEEEICRLACEQAGYIASLHPAAVLCQGESCYTYAMVDSLLHQGIRVLAACSQRQVREYRTADGQLRRDSAFEFVQFREYSRALNKTDSKAG